ncbi:response regulator [Alteromonadaceae bacterium M269]|nr:response regulator [Alteromonadaceae bacterium M269]
MKKISTILIVDDNKSDHIISQVAIRKYDASINVLTAYDGQEALDLLETLDTPPDVILLDINMPGMDGHEFLEEYSKEPSPISIVAMLSTSNQESDKEKCLAYSFVKQYIVKPLEEDDLGVIAALL